jgi:hypothetical protein
VITDTRSIIKPAAVTVEGGWYSHIDANMSPRYDPCYCSAFLVALVHRGEVPNLMYFERITGGSIIFMGDTIFGGAG